MDDLPQSVVESDARNVFGAPTVFQLMALDEDDPLLASVYRSNFSSFHTTHFKRDDLFSLNSEAALSTRNSFGQTLLHLAWLKVGFRLERDDSLRQRDGRGRTSWHHMFTLKKNFTPPTSTKIAS